MKIYFPHITFEANPIVWDLNEASDTATCLMYCLDLATQQAVEVSISSSYFTTFSNVTIKERRVFIENIGISPHLYMPIVNSNRSITRANTSKSTPGFFKEDTTPALASMARITLDYLIPNNDANASLWNDTVAFENYHERNANEDKNIHKATFVKSALSFNIMIQSQKNNLLYPLKSNLVKEIRGLLELFEPAYKTWCANNNSDLCKQAIYHYLQNAVYEAMQDNAFESATPEFTHLNPELRAYALTRVRTVHAEIQLMKFNTLVHSTLHVELAMGKQDTNIISPALIELRSLILNQPKERIELIHQKLKTITDLHIQLGLVRENMKKLLDKLNDDLDYKKPQIMGYRSFRSIIDLVLQKNNQFTRAVNAQTSDLITSNTIALIAKHLYSLKLTKYIAPLSTVFDKDIYLCKEWADKLVAELSPSVLLCSNNEDDILQLTTSLPIKVISTMRQLLELYHSNSNSEQNESSLVFNLIN